MKEEILYRKAFIRMTKKNLGMLYLPLVQYAVIDSYGNVGPKCWKVLQGNRNNFLFTKESYEDIIASLLEEIENGRLACYKSRGNMFTPTELAAWMRGGFSSAYTLDEYIRAGNKPEAILDGRPVTIFQEYQLLKYIRERSSYKRIDFRFVGPDLRSPKTCQKPAEADKPYVLVSDLHAWPSYFCKQLRYSVKSTGNRQSEEVRRFASPGEAEKYLSGNREKLRQHHYGWYVSEVRPAEA